MRAHQSLSHPRIRTRRRTTLGESTVAHRSGHDGYSYEHGLFVLIAVGRSLGTLLPWGFCPAALVDEVFVGLEGNGLLINVSSGRPTACTPFRSISSKKMRSSGIRRTVGEACCKTYTPFVRCGGREKIQVAFVMLREEHTVASSARYPFRGGATVMQDQLDPIVDCHVPVHR